MNLTTSIDTFVDETEREATDMQCARAPYKPSLTEYNQRESKKGNTIVTLTFSWEEPDGGPVEDPFFTEVAASWRAVFSPKGDLIEKVRIY